MRRFVLACAACCLMVCSAVAAPKATGSGERKAQVQAAMNGNPAAGRIKSETERCQECHGVDGNGHGDEGRFAKLAGQYPEYIVKQMRDFRSGVRKHDFMSMMARSVADTDVADIAAYFASQPRMQGEGERSDAAGRNLFINGDTARGITPCASCHGASGQGQSTGGVVYPAIAGQDARYLEKQLLDWRSGERRNSAGGVMSSIAKALTDAELQALVHYLAGK